MSKDTKQILIIWAAVILSGALAWAFINFAMASAANRSAVCSADVKCDPPINVGSCTSGSYEIGRDDNGHAICKLEPTGCPYGDSIPLDSPKCAPNTAEEVQAAKGSPMISNDLQPSPMISSFEGK